MKKIRAAALFAALILVFSACGAKKEYAEVLEHAKHTVTLINNGDYDSAMQQFESGYRDDKDKEDWAFVFGERFKALGSFKEFGAQSIGKQPEPESGEFDLIIADIMCRYENGTMEFRLFYNVDGGLMGLEIE